MTRPVEAIEQILLGETASLTRADCRAAIGAEEDETALRLWRALGFVDVAEGDPVFTRLDLTALQGSLALVEGRGVPVDMVEGVARAMGQVMNRLAETLIEVAAQLTLDDPAVAERLTADPTSVVSEALLGLEDLVDPLQALLVYTWRRHMVAAAQRMVSLAEVSEAGAVGVAVGFCDIVGYTETSREMELDELRDMVARFESQSHDVIVKGGGRVVKTLGDEVMFVASSAQAAAEIGLELAESFGPGSGVPDVRVGVAYGPVVQRGGDLFGPAVNIASRCTEIAHPATVVVDRDAAGALEGATALVIRRMRPRAVRGYGHLQVSTVRRAMMEP